MNRDALREIENTISHEGYSDEQRLDAIKKVCEMHLPIRKVYLGIALRWLYKWCVDITTEWNNHMIKYRWHDLRKDPDDLPKELEIFEILIDDKVVINKPRIMRGYYNMMTGRWSVLSPFITDHKSLAETEFILPDYCDLLAWRYIEFDEKLGKNENA